MRLTCVFSLPVACSSNFLSRDSRLREMAPEATGVGEARMCTSLDAQRRVARLGASPVILSVERGDEERTAPVDNNYLLQDRCFVLDPSKGTFVRTFEAGQSPFHSFEIPPQNIITI